MDLKRKMIHWTWCPARITEGHLIWNKIRKWGFQFVLATSHNYSKTLFLSFVDSLEFPAVKLTFPTCYLVPAYNKTLILILPILNHVSIFFRLNDCTYHRRRFPNASCNTTRRSKSKLNCKISNWVVIAALSIGTFGICGLWPHTKTNDIHINQTNLCFAGISKCWYAKTLNVKHGGNHTSFSAR